MTQAPKTTTHTKGELALLSVATERMARLPGGAATRRLRETALDAFSARGLPHRRIEEWKFTDLRSFVKDAARPASPRDGKAAAQAASATHAIQGALVFVFVDGRLVSAPQNLPQGLSVDQFALRIEPEPTLLTARLPDTVDSGAAALIDLNAALASDGAVVRILPATHIEDPIQIIHVDQGLTALRNRIDVGAGATATLIETHISQPPRQLLSHTSITVGDAARLAHIMDHDLADGDVTFASNVATLGQSALYQPFVLHMGNGAARHQLTLTFKGEGATFDYCGASLVAGQGHADATLVIDHAVPNCISREMFKTVLNDHGRAIFQGKVIVRPDAQKTDGKQMAQALMLSPTAEFDAKPELEIYADDVVCGHGATSAEIDPDQLFYLRARGIPEVEARALLIEGFLGELLDRITHEPTRDALSGRAIAWLRHLGGTPVTKA